MCVCVSRLRVRSQGFDMESEQKVGTPISSFVDSVAVRENRRAESEHNVVVSWSYRGLSLIA